MKYPIRFVINTLDNVVYKEEGGARLFSTEIPEQYGPFYRDYVHADGCFYEMVLIKKQYPEIREDRLEFDFEDADDGRR